MIFSEKEKGLLLELICFEQLNMVTKDHEQYNSDKYKELEELKVKIKNL